MKMRFGGGVGKVVSSRIARRARVKLSGPAPRASERCKPPLASLASRIHAFANRNSAAVRAGSAPQERGIPPPRRIQPRLSREERRGDEPVRKALGEGYVSPVE